MESRLPGWVKGTLAAIAVVAVGFLGVAASNWYAARSDPLVAPQEAGVAAGTSIEWSTVGGTIGPVMDAAASDGVLYVLTTAPDDRGFFPPSRAVFRTSDGENWEWTVLQDRWVNGIAAFQGVLYGVGTAPGAENPGDVQIQLGRSQDGGDTWETFLVGRVDPWSYLRLEAGPAGMAVVSQGDPSAGIRVGTPEDGFTQVDLARGRFVENVYPLEGGFLAASQGELLWIPDPATVIPTDVSIDQGWLIAGGETAGGVAAVTGQEQGGVAVWTTADPSGEWSPIELPPVLDSVNVFAASFSDGIMMLTGFVEPDQGAGGGFFGGVDTQFAPDALLVWTSDFETWEMTSVGDVLQAAGGWVDQLIPAPFGFLVPASVPRGPTVARVHLVGTVGG